MTRQLLRLKDKVHPPKKRWVFAWAEAGKGFSQHHNLELVSFLTGFSLLAYELVAARILAPSIGSSTYVWTGVIGVIIASLSLGFFFGGRIADIRGRIHDIAWLLLLAAAMVSFTLIAYEGLLDAVTDWFTDRRWQAVTAAALLFAPASFLIGMTSPYLAKLKVSSLTATGRSVASLDAFNAIGGIIGTFTTGFILFAYIGSRETLVVIALLLLIASWLLAWRHRLSFRAVLTGILLVILLVPSASSADTLTVDTPSATYKVIEAIYQGRPVTGLVTGPSGTQSAVYQDGDTAPVFWYTAEMARLAVMRSPDTILILGGGAFTLPQHLATQLPNTHIDVVEIDPELREISEQYFGYRNPANTSLYFDDARAFVNETDKRYDMILVDVYGDAEIPFSLMTKEYANTVARLLKPGGLVAVNLIAGTEGPCRQVLSAVHAAYQTSFSHATYQQQPGTDMYRSNNVLVYAQEELSLAGYIPVPAALTPAYTDNFAPAERLYFACQQVQ